MTERRYTGSVEDLLHDQEFVSTVKRVNTEEEWEQFLKDHSVSSSNINQAREIILLFKTSEGTLDKERTQKLWNHISQYNSRRSSNHKRIQLKIFARIAAAVLIVISLGSLLYQHFKVTENHYQFSESRSDLKNGPLLVLSNGTKVGLKKSESKITVLKDQDAIQINNDSIVKNEQSVDGNESEEKYNEVIIPFGKKAKLELADGTKVWLNAGSRFAFPSQFKGKQRAVILDGEAYFEVVKDRNHPFVVTTGKLNVEVLGTKFDVSAYSSDHLSEAVLLEGSINIWDNSRFIKEKIAMAPNQKATYSTGGKIELRPEPDPGKTIAWVDGWYQFGNEKLEVVLKRIERFYNVKFEYNQEVISNALPVSGKLDLKDSLGDVLTVLSGVAKFEYRISGSVIIIKNKKAMR